MPEQPIGELKNGLQADRLSACGFCANSLRLLLHVAAYAIVVLFREATAAIPDSATASVGTLRQRLWKVGAVMVTGARRIWLHVSETWPHRNLWVRVQEAVQVFVARLLGRVRQDACGGQGFAHVRERARSKRPGRLPASRVRAG